MSRDFKQPTIGRVADVLVVLVLLAIVVSLVILFVVTSIGQTEILPAPPSVRGS